MLKTQLKFIITIILTLGLSISFQSLLAAWQAPTASPPNNNIDTPINTGPDDQDKLGGLALGGDLGVGIDLVIGGGNPVPGINSYLEFDYRNDFSSHKGDSARMYRDHTGNYTGNSNNDFLVFEKTDGNSLNPDGGILFTNRGNDNAAELSVAIRGDGSVGIGTVNPSSDLKLDVEGKIGATEYCDEDGNNCTAAADLGSGSLGTVNCVVTGWLNNLDYGVGIDCGEGYLAGETSYHEDPTEDRRFRYKCCYPEGTDSSTMTTCEGGYNAACTPTGWY